MTTTPTIWKNFTANADALAGDQYSPSATPLANGKFLVTWIDRENGLSPGFDVMAQLFKPFTTGGRAGGAGLGLAIAQDLVRAHGGEIALTASGPDGTTFRFTLPATVH